MSQVKVELTDYPSNYTEVRVDGKSAGMIMNRDDDLFPLLRKIIDLLGIENTIVLRTDEDD